MTERNYLAEARELANWPDEPVYVDGIRKAKPIPDIEHLQAVVEHARKLEAQIEQLQARIGSLEETNAILSCEPEVEKLRRAMEDLKAGRIVSMEEMERRTNNEPTIGPGQTDDIAEYLGLKEGKQISSKLRVVPPAAGESEPR